ncbi:N-glycosylase/DNA lyase OGG1 [Vitis vinifera]|uniref:N-glycosylase/DNA lyase OGG1 n=1 Tax=Vitis vinifera TaxID=29760 RepID=A0A438EU61_VITVI|nr:N-glycosylase/DNA lyase OGG1 [Vitis vinifera]
MKHETTAGDESMRHSWRRDARLWRRREGLRGGENRRVEGNGHWNSRRFNPSSLPNSNSQHLFDALTETAANNEEKKTHSTTAFNPPTPTLLKTLVSNSKPTSNSSKKTQDPHQDPTNATTHNPNITKWVPLNIAKSELSLALTFPTGQTFRWKQTTPLQYTGVIGSHLISLKHLQTATLPTSFIRARRRKNARSALLDFLNVGISLSEMWEVFKASDSRFAELAQYLGWCKGA